MSYKYSKGSQVIGDLKAADDTERNTQIDFGEDEIAFDTGGSTRLHVANTVITTTVPLHISGSETQGLRLAKGGSDYREIVFETDGVDTANISISNSENLVIQNETNGKDIQFWVNPTATSATQAMTIKEDVKIGINETNPTTTLQVGGNAYISGTLQVGEFTFPSTDGTNGQVLKTDGNGSVSWQSSVSLVQTLNTITGATGDVTHDCTNSHVFYHSSISGDFTPDFTQITISNGETTETTLILDQGVTGYRPTALKVNSTGSTLYWEGTSAPTASTSAVDMVEMKIVKQSDAFITIAKYSKHEVEIAAPGGGGGVSIPSGALVFLDASDANSYGGSGTTWTDLSDQGNDATIYGSPTYNGTDKLFEMAGGHYMSLGSGFADFSSGATFFFIADFGTADRNWERILDFSVGGATNHAFNVGRSTTSTNLNLQVYSPAGYPVNNWYQVNSNQITNSALACYALTIDGTNAKYYKNGTLVDTQSFVYLPSNTTRTQNYIGRSRAGTNEDLTGKMAVFAIFSRDLTASEISDLFDAYNAIYSF